MVRRSRNGRPLSRATLPLLATLVSLSACGPSAPRPEPAPEPAASATESSASATEPAARPRPRTVQPGAPGEASRVVEPGVRNGVTRGRYSEADVAFMHDMILHHAQALVMTTLVPGRTEQPQIRLLAQRIEASQASEIELMRRWLEARGEMAPDVAMPGDLRAHRDHAAHDGHHAGGGMDHGDMPGMASAEELARLAAAEGDAFDRLFLELMRRHHEGALEMVAELAASGRAQDPEVHMFAGDVDADQRAEIARILSLQNALFQ